MTSTVRSNTITAGSSGSQVGGYYGLCSVHKEADPTCCPVLAQDKFGNINSWDIAHEVYVQCVAKICWDGCSNWCSNFGIGMSKDVPDNFPQCPYNFLCNVQRVISICQGLNKNTKAWELRPIN